MNIFSLGVLSGLLALVGGQAGLLYDPASYPDIPSYGPQPNPDYMVDHQYNYFKTAPDKGKQNGPVWLESGSFENYMSTVGNLTSENHTLSDSAAAGYWLPQLAPLGKQPLAGSNYKFFRDVVKYGADNTGKKDATEAINAAIEDGNRCGLECGNTFVRGAIVYFPPGTYKICRPVIQLYYTQFIGDALDPPTIKGCDTFQGIALFDTDPYIPNGNGQNWYINQNQFFRQIRNFIFDMTEMPLSTSENDQPLVPTGIHWQVSQACSLQNLVFNMPKATDGNKATHVGIFMENGSGGFVSDLEFNGGSIGWRAGSQQYTAINIKFNDCLTAVQMVWDWGFNWQRVEVDNAAIAFNISGRGGSTGQGIGSISIIDSKISNCPIAVLTNSHKDKDSGSPNIVIDNLKMNNVETTVKSDNGDIILKGIDHVDLWAIGQRYDGYNGTYTSGEVKAPKKGSRLLDDHDQLFYRSRPQYEKLGIDKFRIATEHDCKNDGTGDNTAAINTFLQDAIKADQIAYFPAGIYRVGGTVLIPTNSRVQGASWSQIQGAGFYFNDIHNPRVIVQVGEKGDIGSMEIVDMMFTAQGATAGAIILEWNVHEIKQGSAAMWDSHIRVGGAAGTDLDLDTCPKFEYSDACICASLLFHVTPQASGYFENIWIWLADHDNDMSVYDSPDKLSNQISLYAARGTLIESEGPSWFYGTGSEHTVMYQYQLYGAKDIYLGHIQTETPYYQPVPVAPYPFLTGKNFPGDPSYKQCKNNAACESAWGLRIINSKGVTLHGSGLYSFFQEYYQDCVPTHNCQECLLEVRGSKDVVLFNIFTVGTEKIGTGINNGAIFQNDSNQSGFTTEVSVWLPLPGDDDLNIVYVGPEVYEDPAVTCPHNCLLVFPTSSLETKTTIKPGKYTTSLEYGHSGTTSIGDRVVSTFFTTITTITLNIDPITTDGMPYSNINITDGETSTILNVYPSVDISPVPVPIPDGEGQITTRNVTVPPWPDITRGPPESWRNPTTSSADDHRNGVYHTPYVTTVIATRPTVTTISFPSTVSPIVVKCPPSSEVPFNTPKTTATIYCSAPTTISVAFTCPAIKIVTFIGSSAGVFTVDCTVSTTFSKPGATITRSTSKPTTSRPLPVWTTWPPKAIIPIEEEVKDPEPGKTSCNLWFFSMCISIDDKKIGGLRWILPPGIYPPGPPPARAINPPPSWTIKPPLPPWPKITVGRDNIVTYPKEEPTKCEKKSASMCATTVFKTTTTRGTTTSTISSTKSTCDTIYGCSASDGGITTTTRTTVDNCPPQTITPKAFQTGAPSSTESEPRPQQAANGPPPPGCPANAVVYPSDIYNVGQIPQLLSKYKGKYVEIKSTVFHFTSYFWVPYLDQDTMDVLLESPDVADAYYYERWNLEHGPRPSDPVEGLKSSDVVGDRSRSNFSNVALGDNLQAAGRRGSILEDLSQASLAKGKAWKAPDSNSVDDEGNFLFFFDAVAGAGQYVYIIDDGLWTNHHEFKQTDGSIELLIPPGESPRDNDPQVDHGSGVASKVLGEGLGICKSCNIVMVPQIWLTDPDVDYWARLPERVLEAVIMILDDISTKGREGKAVLNISWGQDVLARSELLAQFRQFLHLLEQIVQTPTVCAAGNSGKTVKEIDVYPALFADPVNPHGHLPNLIVVGATDVWGQQAEWSQYDNWMTTFARGDDVWAPGYPTPNDNKKYRVVSGTSLSTPQVAGLVAYFRSLSSPWKDQLKQPANVKKMIKLFHRRFTVHSPMAPNDPSLRKPVIWNGQMGVAQRLKKTLKMRPGKEKAWNLAALATRSRKLMVAPVLFFLTRVRVNRRILSTHDRRNRFRKHRKKTRTRAAGCRPTPDLVAQSPPVMTSASWTREIRVSAMKMVVTQNHLSVVETKVVQCWSWTGGGGGDGSGEPPGPHIGKLLFALDEMVTSRPGGDVWTRFWKVFGSELDGKIDLCWDTPLKLADASSDPEKRPLYPPSMEFIAEGHECKYTGDENGAGILDCEGSRASFCKPRDPQDRSGCPPKQRFTWQWIVNSSLRVASDER
ncbi:hypothetical protein ACJ72_05678, partial [Emergomyces africanus]